MSKRAWLLISLALLALLAPASARAQPRVGVMSLRAAPGSVSSGVFREANNLIWQRIAAVRGILPVAESQIAQTIGSGAYATLRSCQRDDCMIQVAQLAGLDRVVWGYMHVTAAGGYRVDLRLLDVRRGVVGMDSPGCEPCQEAEILAHLVNWQATRLQFANAPGAVATAPPPQPPVRVRIAAPPSRPPPPRAPPLSGLPAAPPPAGYGIAATAAPQTGRLTLASAPSGAEVWVGGRRIGATPVSALEMYPGSFQVLVRAKGFYDKILLVTLHGGEHVSEKVKLRPSVGTLAVRSSPKGATVKVDGRPAGETPIKKLPLAEGKHTVELWLDRHDPLREQVTVVGGKATKLKLKLQPVDGKLTVTSKPGGASVSINGAFVGPTPVKRHVLQRGEHTVTLYLSGYLEESRTVRVKGGKKASLAVKLGKEPPSEGKLVLSSKPSGARIMLDAIDLGHTPRSLAFRKGSYMLRWMLDGYEPIEQRIEIVGGKKRKIHVNLKRAAPPPGTGGLAVSAEPADAEIIIGGRSFGGGAVPEQILMVGAYDITIRKEGFEELSFRVDVRERKRETVHRKMRRLPPPAKDGYLSVASKPSGAEILIDGVPTGTTPLQKQAMKPGQYTVRVVADGHEPAERDVLVQSSRTATLDLRLTSFFGSLWVETVPKGATVLLDGLELGDTPGEWGGLEPGEHEIIISKIGQREHLQRVALVKGDVTYLKINLLASPGQLSVRTKPSGADVYLDRVLLGPSPVNRHSVEPGKHSLEVKLKGYESASGEFSIRSKASRTLEFKLQRLPEPPKPPPPPEPEASGEPSGTPAEAAATSTSPGS